jgi:uncharacterized protein (TIGR02594 family)
MEPVWITHAKKFIGLKETPGIADNKIILDMAKKAKSWLGALYNKDSIPWCGLFVSYCMELAGFKPPKSFVGVRASDWGGWGVKLSPLLVRVPLGAVAVFKRKGGGHVGFVVGNYKTGELAILGGNQSDAVNIRKFTRENLVSLNWPTDIPVGAPAPEITSLAGVEAAGSVV